jgi:hypothetical protein
VIIAKAMEQWIVIIVMVMEDGIVRVVTDLANAHIVEVRAFLYVRLVAVPENAVNVKVKVKYGVPIVMVRANVLIAKEINL